jgi:hypothetical protein
VQLRFATGLTSEEYVSEEGWRQASLATCPLHPAGGCGFERHGTYVRVTPAGTRVARFYCRAGRTTFSLLPDCLASRLSGSLAAVEHVVTTVGVARSVEAAADHLRPDIELPGAVRWVRRRLGPVRAVLLAVVTLLPELAGVRPTLAAVGAQLGVPVLVAVRARAERHLPALAAPVGFHPQRRRGANRGAAAQHDLGPDGPGPPR